MKQVKLYIFLLLLFLSFVLPSNIQVIKYILLCIIIILGVFECTLSGYGNKYLLQHTFMTAICFSSLSLFFFLEGAFNGFDVLRTLNFYIVYPLLFCGIFFIISDIVKFKYIDLVIIVAFIFTLSIFIAYLFGINFELFKGNEGIQNSDGFVKYSFVFFSFWVFAIPYLMTRVFLSGMRAFNKTLLYFTLLIIGLLCGRKAILLNVLILNLIFMIISIKRRKNFMIIFVNVVFASLFAGFFLDYLVTGFQFYNAANVSAYTRNIQFNALVRSILDHPILGTGLASISEYFQRDDPLNPFAYELYYLSLIMWFGLVGFILYSINFLRIIYYSLITYIECPRIEYKKYFIPLMTGFIAFLIASATNPYFAKFDSSWFIFMVVLYSDLMFRKQSNE